MAQVVIAEPICCACDADGKHQAEFGMSPCPSSANILLIFRSSPCKEPDPRCRPSKSKSTPMAAFIRWSHFHGSPPDARC